MFDVAASGNGWGGGDHRRRLACFVVVGDDGARLVCQGGIATSESPTLTPSAPWLSLVAPKL